MALFGDAEPAKQIFRQWDKSGKGLIQSHIFVKVLTRLDPSLTEDDITHLIELSSSSSSDSVNYEKFIDAVDEQNRFASEDNPDRTRAPSKGSPPTAGKRPILVRPGTQEYLMLEDHMNQSQEIKDMELAYSQAFMELETRHRKRVYKYIGRVRELQKAEVFYDKCMTHIQHEAMNGILQSCNLPGCPEETLDLSEFKRCHKAVGQILGDLSQASWGNAGLVFSADEREEFKKANLDNNSTISVAELATWLHVIFKEIQGSGFDHFFDLIHAVELRCRAIREMDKFLMVMELHQGMAQYGIAYRKMKALQTYRPVPSEKPPNTLEQPQCENIDELFQQARTILKKVETLGEELRVNIEAPFWSMGPLKNLHRSQEKIEKDYGGNHLQLLDVVRFSVVCDDLDMVQKAITFLRQRSDIEIKRIKSGFNPEAGSAAQQGGYRDVKLNCAHSQNGHIFEIQLHVLTFYSLKREGGHNLYIWSRQFAVAGIVNATDVLDDLSPDLCEEMSIVARAEIDAVSSDRGHDSIQAMQWKLALVQLAKITGNKEDLKIAKSLYEMTVAKEIPAATVNDSAEIILLAGKSTIYEVDESLKLCERALGMITEIPQEDQTSVENLFVARAYHAIGSCYFFRGKKEGKKGNKDALRHNMELALTNYEQAIQNFGSHLKPHHPMILSIKKNLGGTLTQLNRGVEAVRYLQEVADAIVLHLGDNHLQAGKACFELGNAYQQIQNYNQAIAHLERSLSIRIRNVGLAHATVAMGYLQLGQCREAAGDHEGATRELKTALQLYEDLGKPLSRVATSPTTREVKQTIPVQTWSSEKDVPKEDVKSTNTEKEMKEVRDKLAAAELAAKNSCDARPFFVATVNFLGNAYNAMEFMNSDSSFQVNYPRVKEAFEMLTAEEVIDEAKKLDFNADLSKILPGKTFAEHCTKDFLKRDNKLDVTGRTNMVVAGMMTHDGTGKPLYQHVLEWRDLMSKQGEHYKKDPELVAWDIACNLSAERSPEAFQAISEGSYLNPESTEHNVRQLIDELPKDREFICAVQEFPEEGAKHDILMREIKERGWTGIPPCKEDSSVGFILSGAVKVTKITQSPLGEDPAKVLEALDWVDADQVSESDRKSLKTTAIKTLVIDVEANELRPACRFINVHAKEFKSDAGTRLFARYVKGLAGDLNGYVAIALTDANTPTRDKSVILCDELQQLDFDVLSPQSAGYITTRKQRSQMHGQIYDEKKCLKIVEAHKTYAAIIQSSSGSCRCFTRSNARFHPDLRFDDRNLPDSNWPSDHSMLQIDFYPAPADRAS